MSNIEELKADEKRNVCPFDCPDCCGIIATVKDGKLISVRGDQEHPKTKGFLCRKMQHYEDMVNHPDRILYPMKRVGAKGEGIFERISWEEALSEITGKWKEIIAKYGPEAILPYSFAGTEGILHENCGEAFFHYMGATKLKRTICSSGKGAGWKAIMGDTMGMSAFRLADCDRILVWGCNMAATRVHELPLLQEARSKGARVTLIDVYETPTARYCDDVVLVKPGSDGALALSMIHVLEENGLTNLSYIEKHVQGYDLLKKELPKYNPEWAEKVTGVPADVIRDLAITYGKAERPGIIHGSGPSRRKNGGMMVRCIAALPAVIGSWERGYGICGLNQTGKWGDKTIITRPDFDKNHARSLNMMQLASALDPEKTDPPVMSLYVYTANPVMVTASQKQVMENIQREDLFTVVHERFMTDTARYADIILPATFSTEVYDIFHGYGFNAIHYTKKITEIPGECCSNWNTFARLAEAMGYDDPFFQLTEEEMCMKYMDRKTGQQEDLTEEEWEKVLDGRIVERRIWCPTKFETKNGKILLYNPDVEEPLIGYKDLTGSAEYPLRLVASPSVYTLNSTFTTQKNLVEKRGKMTLILNASDAADRGIQDGDQIVAENELASVLFYARIGPGILPGTVVAEGVYTSKDSIDGKTMNALIREDLSDLGEATTMNGNFIQVRKQ